jgi:DNA-binding ferritin-like protein
MDEITTELRLAMDTVAERIVTLGAIANGQASDAAAAKLAPLPKAPIIDADAMSGMADRLSASAARARQRAAEVADIDPVSESVLLTILEGMEKQIWMLRAGQV